MDPKQAGFCNDPPKPYPSSHRSPSTLPRPSPFNPRQFPRNTHSNSCSPTTHFRPRLRFSALFPALHILKDAFPRRSGSLQHLLQPKTQIKLVANNYHYDPMSLRTDNIMHPSQDPFSRARIPYLECSPPRYVKSSIMDLVKDWENVTIHRYLPL